MLELKNIRKDYKLKDQEPVHALKGISLNFRANEFVAILGHSGCGKTTLLNITGGLDHYDDGDLIIKGRSTKDFKDADWDTYRNHSIGFVFQTYNLIPHQTIIKNVELALTISGISKEERTNRAKQALDLVGLKGLYRKKPNQLSGGQMQRVAIARALINNPEIVLADEPTGALDSETSVQIMDILKEVAKNHLVIMVTHNPELAEKYATRIVRMKDGLITSDTNPYDGKDEIKVVEGVNKGKKKHSSMNFFTAFALSMSNLFSKMKRTILVSLAGSIGIIGVSTILGVSCGVNNFIDDMQNDMLSAYPIAVAEESVDLNSLITGLTTQEKKDLEKFDVKTKVGMDSMISYLLTKYTDLTNIKTNNITETLVQYLKQMPKSYYSATTFDYGADPTNNIFTSFTPKTGGESVDISINGLTQRYIKTLMTVQGFQDYAQFVDLFAGFMNEMPKEKSYIMSQYDLIAGDHFATGDDEIMFVVDENTTLTDLIFAQMGYYPQDEFLNVAKRAIKGNELQKQYNEGKITKEEYKEGLKELEQKYAYRRSFTMEDVLKHDFYYYPHQVLYKTVEECEDKFVSHKVIEGSLTGSFKFGPLDYTLIFGGLEYVPADDQLKGTLMALDNNDNMQPVINQAIYFNRDKSEKVTDVNASVLDGKWKFSYQDIYFEGTITTDKTPVPDPLNPKKVTYNNMTASLKTNAMGIELTLNFDKGKLSETTPETPDYYYEAYAQKNKDIKGKDIADIPGARKLKVAGILRPKKGTTFGTLSRGVYYTSAFGEKYLADANESNVVNSYIEHIVNKRFMDNSKTQYKGTTFNAYTRFIYDSYEKDDGDPSFVPEEVEGFAGALNGGFNNALSSIFTSFMGSSKNIDIEKVNIRAIAGLKIVETPDPSDPNDSSKITYSTELLPKQINVYPKDFERKDNVTNYISKWNKNVDLKIGGVVVHKADREEISYTDTISLIVNVISTLVTTVSAALIAFTSLSLVVSCFMIAVITYISVMERIKEIGVIRSLGGRKLDVSTLFISENVITGFASGTIGIIFTYILQLIINAIVTPYGVSNICALPFYYALMMIGIAILLSVISGFIPSLGASKKDPVIALRTE